MADDEKIGTIWSDDELDAIVADYFTILASEFAGVPYVKSHHSAALMAQIGRTHRSVEFKHQNISAVLEELGMPWIQGYKPKQNYQNAIFSAIDRHLSAHGDVLGQEPKVPAVKEDVFVAAPAKQAEPELPTLLRKLVRKFDPVERDHRNRKLGMCRGAGE